MVMRIVWIVLALGSVLLSGCAKEVGGDYALDEGKNTGVMVASLTRSGLGAGFNLFVRLRGVGHRYDSRVAVTDAFVSSDWGCPFALRIAEHEACGRLAVVELQAGEYEFYAWEGSSGNTRIKSQQPFSKRFRITAGKAVYIGNMHLAVESYSYGVRVSDMRDRDLPLFHSKNPKVAQGTVLVELVQ